MPEPIQLVTPSALIANLPTWWARLRARVKVVGTAMTSRGDKVIILSDDKKHIKLIGAGEFNAPHSGTNESGADARGTATTTETGA